MILRSTANLLLSTSIALQALSLAANERAPSEAQPSQALPDASATCAARTIQSYIDEADRVVVGRVASVSDEVLVRRPRPIPGRLIVLDTLYVIKGTALPQVLAITTNHRQGLVLNQVIVMIDFGPSSRLYLPGIGTAWELYLCSTFAESSIEQIVAAGFKLTSFARVCPDLSQRVPQSHIEMALSKPSSVPGWNRLRNPSAPPSPSNTWRRWLDVAVEGKPFGPDNALIWKAGCS